MASAAPRRPPYLSALVHEMYQHKNGTSFVRARTPGLPKAIVPKVLYNGRVQEAGGEGRRCLKRGVQGLVSAVPLEGAAWLHLACFLLVEWLGMSPNAAQVGGFGCELHSVRRAGSSGGL